MAWWIQILPVFVYKWLAARFCPRIPIENINWIRATDGIMVCDPEGWQDFLSKECIRFYKEDGISWAVHEMKSKGWSQGMVLDHIQFYENVNGTIRFCQKESE